MQALDSDSGQYNPPDWVTCSLSPGSELLLILTRQSVSGAGAGAGLSTSAITVLYVLTAPQSPSN